MVRVKQECCKPRGPVKGGSEAYPGGKARPPVGLAHCRSSSWRPFQSWGHSTSPVDSFKSESRAVDLYVERDREAGEGGVTCQSGKQGENTALTESGRDGRGGYNDLGKKGPWCDPVLAVGKEEGEDKKHGEMTRFVRSLGVRGGQREPWG